MIEKIIAETIGCDQELIKEESKFVEDLGADSLNIVEIVMAIEEEFEMEIPDDDAEELLTVGDLRKYIKENQ